MDLIVDKKEGEGPLPNRRKTPMRIAMALTAAALLATPAVAEPVGGGFNLEIVGHASFVLTRGNVVIYVDPGDPLHGRTLGGYAPPNVILVTHADFDHYDPALIRSLTGPVTSVYVPAGDPDMARLGAPLAHGNTVHHGGLTIKAVPMGTPDNQRHADMPSNGYIVSAAGVRIWIAGDVTSIPPGVANIDVAIIPLRPPFTWDAAAASAAMAVLRPEIVYISHYWRNNPADVVVPAGTDLRIRDWYP